jgi:hypothetical protein
MIIFFFVFGNFFGDGMSHVPSDFTDSVERVGSVSGRYIPFHKTSMVALANPRTLPFVILLI